MLNSDSISPWPLMNVYWSLSGMLRNVFRSVDFFTAISNCKSPVAFCVRSGLLIFNAWICEAAWCSALLKGLAEPQISFGHSFAPFRSDFPQCQ